MPKRREGLFLLLARKINAYNQRRIVPELDQIEALNRNDHLFQSTKNSDADVMIRRTMDTQYPLIMKMPGVVAVNPPKPDMPDVGHEHLYAEIERLASHQGFQYRDGDRFMMIHRKGRVWDILSEDGQQKVSIGLGKKEHNTARKLPENKFVKFNTNDISSQLLVKLGFGNYGKYGHKFFFPYKLGKFLQSERVPENCEELLELFPDDGKIKIYSPNPSVPRHGNDWISKKFQSMASALGYQDREPVTMRVRKNACSLLSKDDRQEVPFGEFGKEAWNAAKRLRGEDGKIILHGSGSNASNSDNDLLFAKFQPMASALGYQAGDSLAIRAQLLCSLVSKDGRVILEWKEDGIEANIVDAMRRLRGDDGKITFRKPDPQAPDPHNDLLDKELRQTAIKWGYKAEESVTIEAHDRSFSLFSKDGSQEVPLPEFEKKEWGIIQRLSGQDLANAIYTAQEKGSKKQVVRKAAFNKDDIDYPVLVQDGETVFRVKNEYLKCGFFIDFAKEPNSDVFRDVSLHEHLTPPKREQERREKFPADAAISAKVIFDEDWEHGRGGYRFEYTHEGVPCTLTLSDGDPALLRAVNGKEPKSRMERTYHVQNVWKLLPTPLKETDAREADFTLQTDASGEIRSFLTKNSLPITPPKAGDVVKKKWEKKTQDKGIPPSAFIPALTPSQVLQKTALRKIEAAQGLFRKPSVLPNKYRGR